jgi:hypothetical protein
MKTQENTAPPMAGSAKGRTNQNPQQNQPPQLHRDLLTASAGRKGEKMKHKLPRSKGAQRQNSTVSSAPRPRLPNPQIRARVRMDVSLIISRRDTRRIKLEKGHNVIVMLACNGYITGQTISVNGGWYMT